MCLIVFAWQRHRECSFVLAANRDEQHARASAPMEWWSDNETVLGGRDLKAGGTWLALAQNGRFACVTNYRELQPRAPDLRSRGELVADFVAGDASAVDYADALERDRYAGFSLLLKDREQLVYVSNREADARVLSPGVYGLSNAALDTPWPKLVSTKAALSELLDEESPTLDGLLSIVTERAEAAPNATIEDLPEELAKVMSTPFVVGDEYGTRCSTAILFREDGHAEALERRFASGGAADGESRVVFLLSALTDQE